MQASGFWNGAQGLRARPGPFWAKPGRKQLRESGTRVPWGQGRGKRHLVLENHRWLVTGGGQAGDIFSLGPGAHTGFAGTKRSGKMNTNTPTPHTLSPLEASRRPLCSRCSFCVFLLRHRPSQFAVPVFTPCPSPRAPGQSQGHGTLHVSPAAMGSPTPAPAPPAPLLAPGPDGDAQRRPGVGGSVSLAPPQPSRLASLG